MGYRELLNEHLFNMAVAPSSESSTKLADSQLHKDLNNIWPEYHKYIDCDSTERIKWLGDLDVLKQFVRNLFGDVIEQMVVTWWLR